MAFPITSFPPSKITSLTPTDFGTQTFKFDDGSSSRMVKFITPTFTQISVEYNGVNGALIASLLDFYLNEAKGLKEGFALPSIFFDRHPAEYSGLISNLTTGNLWWFIEPPSIETVVVNLYNLKFKIENRWQ